MSKGLLYIKRCRPTPDDIDVLRGLRHCLSSIDGRCESLNKRDRQGADSRAFSFMFDKNSFLTPDIGSLSEKN